MQGRLVTLGGLVASGGALLASSCCAIPIGLSLAGAGAGAVSLLGPLQPWRGVLLALSALSIVIGSALILRERARARGAGACPRGRFRPDFVVLGLSALLLAAAATGPLWDARIAQSVIGQTR